MSTEPNTALYDLSTAGKSSGVGTFKHGTLTKIEGGYHIRGVDSYGYQYGTYLDVAYVGYQEEPDMILHDTKDVSGMDFRLGDGELHLRPSDD